MSRSDEWSHHFVQSLVEGVHLSDIEEWVNSKLPFDAPISESKRIAEEIFMDLDYVNISFK